MAHLDISTFSGPLKSIELDKRQALSVGSHPSNDIQVEGDNVDIMHCRISWNKKGFEVVAAGTDGVDLNGTFVQKAQLQPGDVLRVGDVDIKYRDDAAVAAPAKPAAADDDDGLGGFFLKPLSGELDLPLPPPKSTKADAPPLTAEELDLGEIESAEPSPRRKRSREKTREKSSRTQDAAEADRGDRSRDRAKSKAKERAQGEQKSSRRAEPATADADAVVDDGPDLEALAAVAEPPGEPGAKAIRRSTDAAADEAFDERESAPVSALEQVSLRHRLQSRPRRPGERDAVRSPLVLLLGAGAAALVLIGLTFFFIINRQTTQARFDEAQALMDEGKFSQAIKAFDQFIALFPKDPLVDQAKVQLGVSKIERHIAGATPNWPEGLKELTAFINARRDLPDFEEHRDGVRRRAELIAEGAATSAGKVYDRALLAISDEARNLLTRYSPEDAQPADALKRIQAALRVSEAAILKYETVNAAIAGIDAALLAKRPMDALVARRDLLRRYPEFETDKRLVAKLTEILKAEQSLVTRNDESVEATTDDHPTGTAAPLTLVFHARSRTDEVSVGRNVFGVSKDSCYAVDSITGVPVWRRVIGWDTPFFPVPVDTSTAALLLFSTAHDELQLVDQQTGRLLWRQPAVRGATGPPTLNEGQAYVMSQPGTLNKIDLATGQLTSRLTFSQKVLAPATLLNDGARLVVAGSQEVLYTLSSRPLECVGVSYFGHKPDTVVAPLLTMGSLLLMCENQPGEQSLLRVLDTRSQGGLSQVDAATIPGHVIDTPVIRGRDVFVPSTGERVSSFSASDEPGQTPLTVGPRYEPEGAEQSSMFLATGPDRKVWMASRYLRQLQLATDAIQPGSKVVNIGLATQPIQLQGGKLYIGRAQPFSSATTLFQTDQEDLTSDWQTVVGARLLGWGSYPDQEGLVAANESGDLFRINDAELAAGGFLTTTTVRLKLPEGLQESLGARQLEDGRIAVWCGAPEPQLWIVNRVGQTDRPIPLPGPLECAPVLLDGRLVAAVSGELHLLRGKSGDKAVQAFSLPQAAGDVPRWRQLLKTNDTTLVAATEAGILYQVRLQTSPQAFLGEAGQVELGESLAFQLALGEGQGMLAAVTGQRLQLLDAATLEPRREVALSGPVSNDVWISGERVFVETARQELQAYSLTDESAAAFSLPLEGVPVAGAPLTLSGRTLVALQDGRLLDLDSGSGAIVRETNIGQGLGEGPRVVGTQVVIATVDGSLVRVGTVSGDN